MQLAVNYKDKVGKWILFHLLLELYFLGCDKIAYKISKLFCGIGSLIKGARWLTWLINRKSSSKKEIIYITYKY